MLLAVGVKHYFLFVDKKKWKVTLYSRVESFSKMEVGTYKPI